MSLLQGKTALIFGVANDRSIAWGITQAFHQNGARIGLSYAITLFAAISLVLSQVVFWRVPRMRALP